MKPPHGSLRIAALQPSISVTLDRLGCLDSLVACTRYCLEAVPALRGRNLQVIADSWSSNTEEILSTSPNLVLASVPYRLESLAAILKCGVPVLTLAPHSLADIYQDIRLIGSILHVPDRAQAVIDEMLSQLAAIKRAVQTAEPPLVYCEEWGKPLIHSQSWVAELIAAAGGRFLGKPGSVTDAETVAALDPDVLIFAWCGAGDRVPLHRVVEKRQWQSLRAVRTGRVFCIPDELLNTPAPTLLQGLHALARAIHPQIFGASENLRSLLTDGLERATSKII
jgi:iron complex transport system substrate-binding protein